MTAEKIWTIFIQLSRINYQQQRQDSGRKQTQHRAGLDGNKWRNLFRMGQMDIADTSEKFSVNTQRYEMYLCSQMPCMNPSINRSGRSNDESKF